MIRPRWLIRILAGLGVLTLLTGLGPGAPVLHEYFDPDLGDLNATGLSNPNVSGFPSQLDTASGPVDAPRLNRPNPAGSYAQSAERDAAYQLDRDTSRPELVGYSDPFTPSVAPFKRSFAYDTLDSDFRLTISDATRKPLPVGQSLSPGDDQFFADMNVTLRSGQAVRIPSVGPHARVIGARLVPEVAFQLLRDSAENWFITSRHAGDYRLIMHLAIDPRVFGSEFADVSWTELARSLPALPDGLDQQTQVVISHLGLGKHMAPAEALRLLVEHFRSFSASEERPDSSGVALYQDIALSRKGVCRHRSFAFVVTALGLGIPARLVRNEAHAWVEAYDGQLWHRIDLGGAAGRMEMSEPGVVPHTAPADPYAWPSGSESGTEMAEQAMTSAAQPGSGSSTAAAANSAKSAPGEPAEPSSRPSFESPSSDGSAPDSDASDVVQKTNSLLQTTAPALLSITARQKQAVRGARLNVQGEVLSDDSACELTRVDIKLQSEAGQWHQLGTLVTNESGRYGGAVSVPNSVPVGDYELFVTTPGGRNCGPGNSLDSQP